MMLHRDCASKNGDALLQSTKQPQLAKNRGLKISMDAEGLTDKEIILCRSIMEFQ
jgi:hypothetical protein